MIRKATINEERFAENINWNDPPAEIQDEISARIEAMQLARVQNSMKRSLVLAKRIMSLRACGWNDRDISLEVGGGMTPASIRQLLATYGTQASKEIAERGAD
jgi:hypothetical protein